MHNNKKEDEKTSIILLIIATELKDNKILDIERALLITLEHIQDIHDTFVFDNLEKKYRLHLVAIMIKDFIIAIIGKEILYMYENSIDILDRYIITTDDLIPVPPIRNKNKLKHGCIYDPKNMKVCTAKSSMNIFEYEKTCNRTKEQMVYKILQSLYASTPYNEKYLYFDISEYYRKFYNKQLNTSTRDNYEQIFKELFSIKKNFCDGILLHDIKGLFIGVMFKVVVNKSIHTKFPIKYLISLDLNKSIEVGILFLIHRKYIYAIKNYNKVTTIKIEKDIMNNISRDFKSDIKNYSKNYKNIYDKTICVLQNLKDNKYHDTCKLIKDFIVIDAGMYEKKLKIIWEDRA